MLSHKVSFSSTMIQLPAVLSLLQLRKVCETKITNIDVAKEKLLGSVEGNSVTSFGWRRELKTCSIYHLR